MCRFQSINRNKAIEKQHRATQASLLCSLVKLTVVIAVPRPRGRRRFSFDVSANGTLQQSFSTCKYLILDNIS